MTKTRLHPYLAVPNDSRKKVEEQLKELDLLRSDRRIPSTGGRVFFPLKKAIKIESVFPDVEMKGWTTGSKKFAIIPDLKPKRPKRRTLAERAESIFKFIDKQEEPFPKSDFQKIGLNPTTAESWIRLIEYIQSQPMIKITKMGSSTFIERLENKYLSMLRKRVLDSSLSLQERSRTMDDYVNALQTLEKLEDGRIKK